MLWRFSNILKVIFTFDNICTPKTTQKSSQVFERVFAYFRLYLKIPGKIISSGVLWRFSNIFKVILTFDNFASQKPQKNHHRSLKDIWHQPKLLLLFKMNVKVFDKIVSLAIFVIFAIIFKVIFSFDNVFTSKTSNNCHRSLKWIWHCLNLSMSRVFIKISDKIISYVALLEIFKKF